MGTLPVCRTNQIITENVLEKMISRRRQGHTPRHFQTFLIISPYLFLPCKKKRLLTLLQHIMLTLYLTTKRAESCAVCIDCSVQQLDHYRMLDSITYVVCCDSRFTAKECHLLYYKLHGNSTALFTGDFSIINEPYVCSSLQLTGRAITHSTSSARGLNSLFVFSTFSL